MKFKIVADSSCNLRNDYINDPEVGFEVIPLTLRVDNKDFVDDENLKVPELLEAIHSYKGKATSSCPSPMAFGDAYKEAEYVFCVTISAKLSGSFNAAFVGEMDENPNTKVHVIDSKGTAGSLVLIIDKAYELIKQGLSFEEISEKLDEFQRTNNLLFVLDRFDNLVKNGRMSKIVAFVASSLSIKPLCIADDGEIKIYKKLRTMKMAVRGLVAEMKEFIKDTDISQRECIVSCIAGEEVGEQVKKLIEETYNFKEVKLIYNTGLCSFYALEGGLIVTF